MKKNLFTKWFRSDNDCETGDAKRRALRAGGYSALSSLIVIAIAVAAVFLVGKLPASVTKLDATEAKLFSLSQRTEQMVSAIDSDVTIYLVAHSGEEDDTLLELLDRYKGLSRNISVVKVDPVISPNFIGQYTDSTLQDNSLVIVSGERYRYIGYADIYQFDYTNYNADGSVEKRFAGENLITGAIDFVTTDVLPKAYQLTGHGESGFISDAENAVKSENIVLEDINLLTVDAIPADCACLVIIAPKTDFSADEAAKIKAYLASGGKMLLITEYVGKSLENFDALMADYGVSLVPGIVVEGSGNHSLRGYSHYLLPEIATHTITSPLRIGNYYVLMPIAQGLAISETLRDTVGIASLLTTSDAAYSKVAGFNMTTYDREADDISGPFVLGVAITDALPDAQTQIIWLTSTDMLLPKVNTTVSGGNYHLLANAINWMCARENAIAIENKSMQSAELTVPTSDAVRWSLTLIFVIPLLFVAIGITVVVIRKRK